MAQNSDKAPVYRVPGTSPSTTCNNRNTNLTADHGIRCNRRLGHGGRHAYILWGLRGLVRAVWSDAAPDLKAVA